jgi:hypothetical protein
VTCMGKIVTPRDERKLADALVDVISNHPQYLKPREEIERLFSVDATVDSYEQIYRGEF